VGSVKPLVKEGQHVNKVRMQSLRVWRTVKQYPVQDLESCEGLRI